MNNNKLQTKSKNNFPQPKRLKNKPTLKNVRQDKYAFPCARTASSQPVTVKKSMRACRLNTQKPRLQKGHNGKKRPARVTVYFEPIVRRKIEQIASEWGVSIAILQKSIQESIIREQAKPAKPIIEDTIIRDMQEAYEVLEGFADRPLPKKPIRRKN